MAALELSRRTIGVLAVSWLGLLFLAVFGSPGAPETYARAFRGPQAPVPPPLAAACSEPGCREGGDGGGGTDTDTGTGAKPQGGSFVPRKWPPGPVHPPLAELFDAYDKLHADILAGREEQRYVLFSSTPEFGMGNKLSVLFASLMYAVASRRALLVDWPYMHNTTIHHMSRAALHPGERDALLTNLGVSHMFEDPGIAWNAAPLAHEIVKGPTKHIKDSPNDLACADLTRDHKTEFATVNNWLSFMPAVGLNPAVRSATVDVRNNLMHHVARRYFRPLPHIVDHVNEEFANMTAGMKEGEGVLGLQIRSQVRHIAPLLARDDYLSGLVACAASTGLRRWILVTDDPAFRERISAIAAKTLPEHVHVVWYDAPISRETDEGVMQAFVELQLMARCDAVMHLFSTTFGRTAAALHGGTTYIFGKGGECNIRPGSEPCYEMWPGTPKCLKGKSLFENALHSKAICGSRG